MYDVSTEHNNKVFLNFSFEVLLFVNRFQKKYPLLPASKNCVSRKKKMINTIAKKFHIAIKWLHEPRSRI